ncbi:MAG TPA: glycoside hydrolase family 88 protein [Bryobacteraceae bacterium]|nr:glycoside hydrolase family 88 protein [Bryobacteraceae bacterium]HPT26465.1 glycoside hydrolase family 88 protein [Bryobacteraceae bacterium]
MIQFGPEIERETLASTLDFAARQVRRLADAHPGYYPIYSANGKWKHEGPAWSHWCDGFLPGMMWIFHRRAVDTADKGFWMDLAIEYSRPLESRQFDKDTHDLGFIFLSTYYRWYMITREPNLNDVLVQAGRTMAARFKEKGQYLCSFVSEDSLFIDIMMNVGIIFYAARETNDRRLRDIAMRHVLTTRRYLVRGDGSTAHEGIFDLDTGEFLRISTHQGYRSDSCWSRGLCWAMYGFGVAYEYTHDPRFLATAQDCADYYITHTNSDGLPPWDFLAPQDSRRLVDTSAAAIAASALLRLCRMLPDPVKGFYYWSCALHILKSLCENHTAVNDPEWEGILKGGVYHMQKDLGVNESVMWGDYFFCEALENALRHSPINEKRTNGHP